MTSTQLRTLNAYPDWNSVAQINQVKAYVVSNYQVYPPNLSQRQQDRYDEKFGSNYEVVANRLYYRPVQPAGVPLRVDLEVIPPAGRPQALQAVFNNPREGLGVGLNQFYAQICKHYLGIKRTQTSKFLKSQGNYNLTVRPTKVVNKPILAKTSNERWGLDVIHMPQYCRPHMGDVNDGGRAKYIMTVVDYFSKKVWARPLQASTAVAVRNAFANVCATAHTFPHILQTDNGAEFTGQPFTAWIAQHPMITQVFSTPYSPQTNGLVERMNQEVRKKIASGMVRNNDFEWVHHLQDYCDNINSQKTSTHKYTPDELWSQGYNPPVAGNIDFNLRANDGSSAADIQSVAQAKLVRNAQNMLQRGEQPHVYHVGDIVRIKMSSLYANLRLRKKNGILHKYTIVRYTSERYRVLNAFRFPVPVGPNNQRLWDIHRTTYTLATTTVPPQILVVNAQNNVPKQWFASDMQLVTQPSVQPTIPNRHRGQVINRV